MAISGIGRFGGLLTAGRLALLLGAAACAVSFLAYGSWKNSSVECVRCHGDKKKMEELKAPWAYITDEMVREESRHPHILCRDCHLGDGRAREKEAAHRGMLKMLIVSDHGDLLDRRTAYPYGLSSTGDDRLSAMLPQSTLSESASRPVRNILWHDRSPETFDFDPKITEKTCGKSGCHPEELKQFKTSVMGKNHRQRTMQTWLKPYGPHNCGPSFADLRPSASHERAAFDFTNTKAIMKEMKVPFSEEQAKDKQKLCNVCHAGCIDCHFTPGLNDAEGKEPKSGGAHIFRKTPPAESCAGFGRGNTICHPGAMHSRRGETYIGGDYSMPQGMAPDVHYKKGLGCVACHPPGEGGMGHVERKASCQDCHLDVEEASSKDVHRSMDCATCHISELRGYQITAWGPGKVAGRDNPFNKYSLYYGVQSPPILMKDQKGIWMPVKVWPHSLANVREDVRRSEGLTFRWPGGETRDAYYVVGTREIKQDGGDRRELNNRHLLWLEIEQAAHPFGRARSCGSCHESGQQVSFSRWEFMDDQGAPAFSGSHRIEAGRDGLRIAGLGTGTPIQPMAGYSLADFAPWVYFRDAWKMPGDFSIGTDRAKYLRHRELAGRLDRKLKLLDGRAAAFEKKKQIRYRSLRAYALHDPVEGLKRLDAEFP